MIMERISSKQTDNFKTDLSSNEGLYKFKSESLVYRDNKIYFTKFPQNPVNLDNFYIPITESSPKVKLLSDDRVYINTALALCDLKIRRLKGPAPAANPLTRAVTAYFNLMLFLRDRNIYYLKDATLLDIQDLVKKFAVNGWKTVLNTDEKISSIIAELTPEYFQQSVNFRAGSNIHFDSLRKNFWRKRVGFKSTAFFTKKNKVEFERKANAYGFYAHASWEKSFSGAERAPTNTRIRNLMSSLNHLHFLPDSVDKLTFFPFASTSYESKKYAHKLGKSTDNLDIDAASHILGRSMDWIYNYGPKLVDILEASRKDFQTGNTNFRKIFLRENNPFHELASDLGIPAPNVWMKKANRSVAQDYFFPVDKLIGALQGACAVAIAGFNARRSAEVCDKNIGLREIDLLRDAHGDFHKVNFYIEKSYQEKHSFYVNKVTVDAITLLAKLKSVCAPLTHLDATDYRKESLFNCYFWTTHTGPKAPNHFTFSRSGNQPRSLASFLSFLNDEFKEIDLKSHMWRRFFALVYIYRYDHSNLLSLSQHLRHMGIAQTMIYVTDPNARLHNESIYAKVQNIKGDKILDLELLNSLYEENRELNEVIDLVKKEKFKETVQSILKADKTSGGFPRLIRKIYRSFSRELNFSKLTEIEKIEAISTILISREYDCNPMHHGQCNAPTHNATFGAKCSNDGELEKVKASAIFCQNCMYHSKNDGYIQNLKQEIIQLEEDILSDLTPRHVKKDAIIAKKSLIEVIRIHEESAQKNMNLVLEMVGKNAN